MKKRNRQPKKSIVEWMEEMMDAPIVDKDPDFQEAYQQLLNAYYIPPMRRRILKVKRKNGRIETHILFSDGSIHDSNIPLTKMKKGDVCLGEE